LLAEKCLAQPFEHGDLKQIDCSGKINLSGILKMKFFKRFA